MSSDATRDRALMILARLPPGPFTMVDFLGVRRAMGLRVIGDFDDIAQILHYLIEAEMIRRFDESSSQPSMWVRSEL